MQFFNLHTHSFTNQAGVTELVNQYPHDFEAQIPFYSIGIHPWYIIEESIEADFQFIASKINEAGCLALGECGLDKRIEIPMDLQQLVFEKQLALAEKHQKPIVIHCVAAFAELIAIKKRMNLSVPMIVHGFSKNAAVAKSLLDHGFYLSFGKYLLRNPDLESVFKFIPNDRFFLETDTIEEGIQAVYAVAAQYKNINLETLQNIIQQNFNTIFKNG